MSKENKGVTQSEQSATTTSVIMLLLINLDIR